MLMEAMDCSKINRIKEFGATHIPRHEEEKMSNLVFIGAVSEFNVELEIFVNEVVVDPTVQLIFLKDLQSSISKLLRITVRHLKIVRDKQMSIFLEQSCRVYKSINQVLVDEIISRHQQSYTKVKHKQRTSEYKDIIEVYANE